MTKGHQLHEYLSGEKLPPDGCAALLAGEVLALGFSPNGEAWRWVVNIWLGVPLGFQNGWGYLIDFPATKDADNKLIRAVSGKSLEPTNAQRQQALILSIR